MAQNANSENESTAVEVIDTTNKGTVATNNGPKNEAVNKMLQKYSAIAAAAALIPVPALDMLAFIGIQVKMLHDLGKMYNVKIEDNKAKVAISALVTAVPARSFGAAAASIVKIVPGIGTALGALTGPAYYAAATYAVGRVFNSHFASGGVLLDFKPEEFKDAYKKYYEAKASEGSQAAQA